jgi:hypothetical protein
MIYFKCIFSTARLHPPHHGRVIHFQAAIPDPRRVILAFVTQGLPLLPTSNSRRREKSLVTTTSA